MAKDKRAKPKRRRASAQSVESLQHAESVEENAVAVEAMRVWGRRILSLLILVHLFGVVLPPLAFQSTGVLGESSMVATLVRPIAAYSQFLYLDRGYAFFAPDPGPSHLFQAAVTEPSGELVETIYPDRQKQWPRLNYHRHFMLSEYLYEIYQQKGPPPELVQADPEAAEEWEQLRRRYQNVWQSIVDHLSHENGGKPVAIRRLERLIPDHLEYQELDVELNDPRLLDILLDVSPVAQPRAPESIPAPAVAEEELTAPDSRDDALSERSRNRDMKAVVEPTTAMDVKEQP